MLLKIISTKNSQCWPPNEVLGISSTTYFSLHSPTAIPPGEEREPTEDGGDCLKEPSTLTESITHPTYYQHTPTGSIQSTSPWQHSKLLAAGYWPPTTAPPPVVDMFLRPTLRQHYQHLQPLPPPQTQGTTLWSYEDACHYNPAPYQTDFYSDSSTYIQPMGGASNSQWDSQNCSMRGEDVVVSGRFQLQLEVQARIRRGETGAMGTMATSASSGTSSTTTSATGGGYLPNGPSYGMTYSRRPQGDPPSYIDPQYRQEDGHFVGH